MPLTTIELLSPLEQATVARQAAVDALDQAWEELRKTYAQNNKRLCTIEVEEARAHRSMQQAHTQWKRERRRGHKGGIRRTRKQYGNAIREWQRLNTERSRLVGGIAQAKRRHDKKRELLEHAKEMARTAGKIYLGNEAKEPFFGSAEEIQRLYDRISSDKRDLAQKAGVPREYLDEVVVTRTASATHCYFGGIDTPDGLNHAHYIMNGSRTVIYRRDPSEFCGGQRVYPRA